MHDTAISNWQETRNKSGKMLPYYYILQKNASNTRKHEQFHIF